MMIRVLVASEVRLYREGLQRALQDADGISLVGIASSAEEVVEQGRLIEPDVALLDLAIARSLTIAKHFARAPLIAGVVILGIPELYSDVAGCLPAAALGFVKQDGTVADLLLAIRNVGRGEVGGGRRFPPPVPPRNGIGQLTVREMEILRLMQQGLANKEISRQLGIELSTVKNHVHSVLAKLGVRCRTEATSLLYRHDSAARQHGTLLEDEDGVFPPHRPAIA